MEILRLMPSESRVHRLQRGAGRIAGALIGALAGMFALQLLALPALALLFGVFWGLQRLLGRLDGGAQIAWNITVILSMLGLFVSGTVFGLVGGWGVGQRVASGSSVMSSLAGSRIFGAFSRRHR